MGNYSIDISSSEESDTDDGQRRNYHLRSASKKKMGSVFGSVDNTKSGGGKRSTRSNTSSTTKKGNKSSTKRGNLPMRSTRSSHHHKKIAHNPKIYKALEDGFEDTQTEGHDDELSVASDAAVFSRDSNKGKEDGNTSKSAVVPKSFWSLEDYRDTGVMSDDDDDDERVATSYDDKDDIAPDEAEEN